MERTKKVIVLNADYSYLTSIDWKRAINLIIMGKVEVLKTTTRVIKSVSRSILVPSVIKWVKFIRKLYKGKVPWNKKNVLIRDKNQCQYCRTYFSTERLTIDHIIPSSRGGKNTFVNCVASCKICNNKKGDRTPNEAHMPLIRSPFQPTIMEFITIKMKSLGVDKIIEEIWEY